MNKLLCLRDVSLRFGSRTLFSNLNIDLHAGQMLGVAGESGCGKTSLLRAILGFVPFSGGEAWVCGLPLDAGHIDELRRMTAYVPQELQPVAATGHDLVSLTHTLRANRGMSANVTPLLGALGLDASVLDLQAAKLSGGQRQRILLASALALPKPLLLLDEPTSALDAETSHVVVQLLRDILLREQRAAVVVSHSRALLDACDSTLTIAG